MEKFIETFLRKWLRVVRGGSRVVKSFGCGARGPRFEFRCRGTCWAVMELFVYSYLYEFILCLVCICIRCFTLCVLIIELEHRGKPITCMAAYYTRAKPRVMFGCVHLLCVLLYQCCPA